MSGQTLSRVARFLIGGGSATLLNAGLLWLCTRDGAIGYLSASVLAYSTSVLYNFCLQRTWTFNVSHGSISTQFPLFVIMSLVGLTLNTVALYVLVGGFGLPLIASQVAASAAVAGLSFVAYRRIFLADDLLTRAAPMSHGEFR